MAGSRIITVAHVFLASIVALFFLLPEMTHAAQLPTMAQLYAPAVSTLGAESVLSLSAQSESGGFIDLATKLAIVTAVLVLVTMLTFGTWSSLTSETTPLGKFLNRFRIDHLYMDIGLAFRESDSSPQPVPCPQKSFLRSLSLDDARLVTRSLDPGNIVKTPAAGQIAEILLPGVPQKISGRVIRATPIHGLKNAFQLDVKFEPLASDQRTNLVGFIDRLKHPVRA
jgi:hypothetical protein